MAITQRGLTLEQFLELPEEKPALEYFEGVVTQKVPPQFHHSMLQYWVASRINDFTVPRKLALALPEIRWNSDRARASRVPDVGVYFWDRVPRNADGELVNDQWVRPDIAIEIRSPEQSLRSQIERCRWYVDNDVLLSLLVDSIRRRVHLFRPGVPEAVLRGTDVIDLGDVLPGFQLTVDELFASLRLE
jgi:Uma2 family endonuclease